MLKFLKVILAILSFFLLIFLIKISFFSVWEKSEKDLSFLNDVRYSDKVEINSFSGSTFFKKNINLFDSINYTNSWSFLIEENKDEIKIKLEKGTFILDLNDLTKKYSIISDKGNFNIDIKSIWSLYVDTSEDDIFIFSINSTVLLKFLDEKMEFMNSYFIYPHQFIKFNYKFNKEYENSDLYRIRTLTKNWYIKGSLFNIVNDLNEKHFLKWESKLFFNSYINFKYNEYKNNILINKKLLLLEDNLFPFEEYINKYSYSFINDSKKVIFLQNTIYNNIILFVKDKSIKSYLIDNINSELVKLKILDEEKYNDMLNVIDAIYKISLDNNLILNNTLLKKLFILKTNNKDFSKVENYLLLKKIYFHYDFWNVKNSELYFDKFLEFYFKNNWIVKEDNKYEIDKEENNIKIESFTFFLNEYLNSNLFVNEFKQNDYKSNIFNKYLWVSDIVYFGAKKDVTQIKTWLTKNRDLLKVLLLYISNNLFVEWRDESTNLLILKENNIELEKISALKKQIYILFETYNENLYVLENEKGREINESYQNMKKEFDEKFIAIEDYEKYSLENDEKLKNLYSIWTINEKGKIEINIDYVYNYFNNFNWIRITKSNISKDEELNKFSISNLLILNKKYNADFFELGKVIKIYEHDTSEIFASYDLEYLEELFNEKFDWAWDEDKDKYNFKNFFNEKFKNPEKIIKKESLEEICEREGKISDWISWCIDIVKDSAAITVIKRDKLIWGEFKTIKEFFKIKYNNLIVLENQSNKDKFDITIKDALLTLNFETKRNSRLLNLIFSSSYDLERHKFFNMKIKFLDDEKNDLLDWIYIKFAFKYINIWELEEFLDNFLLNDFSEIEYIYKNLRWEYILNNLEIWFIWDKKYLKFENNWKNIMIKFDWGKILSVNKDGTSILSDEISISEFKTIIYKLK